MKTLIERVKSPTPSFFKKLRNAGLMAAAISGTILTLPIALPIMVVNAAGYLAIAASVASAVSQTAVKDE